MNLYQIRYFLAVVETGGFTRAAERSFVTQPTLSAGIAKLEGELGASLFDRGGRRVSLTSAGTRFLERARVIVRECNAARAELGNPDQPERLRAGVLSTIPARRMARLMGDFAAAHAGVALELVEGSVTELARLMDRGRIDLALTVLPAERRRGRSQVLARENYLIAIAQAHPLARKPELRLDDLRGVPFVARPHCEVHARGRRVLAGHGIRPHTAAATNNDERALDLVAAGLGAALMPECYAAPGVAMAPCAGLDFDRRLGLTWREGAPDAAATFRSFAASHDWAPERTRPGRLEWAR